VITSSFDCTLYCSPPCKEGKNGHRIESSFPIIDNLASLVTIRSCQNNLFLAALNPWPLKSKLAPIGGARAAAVRINHFATAPTKVRACRLSNSRCPRKKRCISAYAKPRKIHHFAMAAISRWWWIDRMLTGFIIAKTGRIRCILPQASHESFL